MAGEQQQPGFDRQREPGVAAPLPNHAKGVQQHQRPQRARQHRGPELDPGKAEHRDRRRQHDRKHGLLPADDGSAELEQRPHGDDKAQLRQQIDTDHVIAGKAIGDVGEPERQRRPDVGADLIFPAERQQGGDVTWRAAIEQQRQHDPQGRLRKNHAPENQLGPGADQFDDQGSEAHDKCRSRWVWAGPL